MFSILRNNKKGALELSMNAIVIIVLAFAMLGLGLVFTRTLLTQATAGASSVTDTAREQILDSLRESDKKMSVQKDIKVSKGDSSLIGIGLKNLGETPSEYTISVKGDATGAFTETSFGSFTWNPAKTLSPGEADVITIRFASINSATTGTKLFTVSVSDANGVYATQDFFVTVQ